MRAHVYLTLSEIDPADVQGATVVVIDVLRATTTMVEALANGARGIYPTTSIEEAVKLASSLGREDTLLCGERKGVMIEGFDLGNSPAEFTREVVEDKRLVMSTTNGTVALAETQDASRVIACALTNLSAVADAVRDDEHVVVLCAGRMGRFSLEDTLCAGLLLRALDPDGTAAHELDDAARASVAIAETMKPSVDFLSGTKGGKAIESIGLGGDLALCAEVDRCSVVPEMRDQALVVEGG